MRSLTCLVALAATGCFHYTMKHREPAPNAVLVEHSQRVASPFWGLTSSTVDVREHCANPVRTEIEATFMDMFIGVITLGIYPSEHVTVVCDGSAPTTATASP